MARPLTDSAVVPSHGGRGGHDLEHCWRFHAAIELIGRRWNGMILRSLLSGPMRFTDIKNSIPRLTDAMLSQRLNELEDAGLVERTVLDERPVQVTYSLTTVGHKLGPVLSAVANWGHEWSQTRNTPN